MKQFLILCLLVLSSAVSAFAADFDIVGVWSLAKEDTPMARLEFYRDGKVLLGEKESDEILVSSTYTVQSVGEDSVYILVEPPASLKRHMEEDESITIRIVCKILSPHKMAVQALEVTDKEGTVVESDVVAKEHITCTRRN